METPVETPAVHAFTITVPGIDPLPAARNPPALIDVTNYIKCNEQFKRRKRKHPESVTDDDCNCTMVAIAEHSVIRDFLGVPADSDAAPAWFQTAVAALKSELTAQAKADMKSLKAELIAHSKTAITTLKTELIEQFRADIKSSMKEEINTRSKTDMDSMRAEIGIRSKSDAKNIKPEIVTQFKSDLSTMKNDIIQSLTILTQNSERFASNGVAVGTNPIFPKMAADGECPDDFPSTKEGIDEANPQTIISLLSFYGLAVVASNSSANKKTLYRFLGIRV